MNPWIFYPIGGLLLVTSWIAARLMTSKQAPKAKAAKLPAPIIIHLALSRRLEVKGESAQSDAERKAMDEEAKRVQAQLDLWAQFEDLTR